MANFAAKFAMTFLLCVHPQRFADCRAESVRCPGGYRSLASTQCCPTLPEARQRLQRQ